MRTLLSMLLLMISVLLTSCASKPHQPPESHVAKYGNIAIVPARYTPETQFVTFARGPVTGAVKGGVAGAAAAVSVAAIVGFGTHFPHPLTGVLTGIILLPITVPLGVVGGLTMYTSEDIAVRTEKLINNAVLNEEMSVKVSNMIANRAIYLPNVNHQLKLEIGPQKFGQVISYSSLNTKKIKTVLEVGVVKAGFKLGGKHNTIRLYIHAQTRLVNVSNDSVITINEFSFESDDKTLASWSSNKGKYLHDAFISGYRELADRIFDNLLEQQPYWPFKTNVVYFNKDDNEAYCWLKPIMPQCEYIDKKTKRILGLKIVLKEAETKFTNIDVSQRALAWQRFPRQQDVIDKNTDILKKIADISYDLRIWNWNGSRCDPLVYERVQLPEPHHRIETKLNPGGKYCWSFRARYLFNEQLQFTGWSYSALPLHSYDEYGISPLSCDLNDIPNIRYYRFQVPFN